MPKSGRGAAPEPVEEPVEVAPAEPAPPTFREKLLALWEEGDLDEQRRLASELMELPDGPSHSMQAMTLDNNFAHLLLAKDAGMNVSQCEKLLELMKGVEASLADDEVSMADAFTQFKQGLMANCDLVHSKSAKELAEEQARKKAEEEAAAAAAAAAAAEAEKSKGAKKGKGGKAAPAVEDATPDPSAPPTPRVEEDVHFSQAMVKAIADYVTTGVFGHYRLHKAVFTPKFECRKNIIARDIQVETVVPDGLGLADAVELVDEEEVEVDRETLLSQLVEQRLREATEAMAAKLRDNQEKLNARLEALQAKKKK